MYEQNGTTPPRTAARQDAIEISDFVYAATGARVRRLTLPDGTHWFPAVDVCKNLGYAHVGSTLRNIADAANFDSVESVLQRHTLGVPAGREWRRDMNVVNLKGLILMVNACTKPEAQPFKLWVSQVIATIQQEGSYSLEPAPVQSAPAGRTAYVMPEQVVDAIVRLEERAARTNDVLGQILDSQRVMTDVLRDVAASLRAPSAAASTPTPAELLATWRTKNLVVTEDVHAVAALLAPALTRGEARYGVAEIAARTGLPHERVHDCLRMLLKRGCVRQRGCTSDGSPVYALP
ncbi:Bro-N domain-containing protein [Streptomyces sp. NPDC021608]|uniref:BRO-N domain-containing protein n=1 Tax=Streptomyces sp. NPDC021608 TaxID=3154903 RepID=UPI00340B2A1A